MTESTEQSSKRQDLPFGMSEEKWAAILLFVLPALFASNMLMARATADFIPPIALGFWRWVIAFLLLLCFVGPKLWAKREAIKREWLDLVILGALGMGVCGTFVYIAADTTTATNIGLIYSAAPVLIILLARTFHREDLSGLQMFGALVSLAGVLVIITQGDLHVLIDLEFVAGDFWVLAAVVAWAVYSIMLRYRSSELGLMTRLAAICGGGVLVMLPFTIWEAMAIAAPTFDMSTLGAILFIAVVSSFGAYQVHGFVQKTLGASRTSLLMYLIPVYNAVLAFLILGEVLEVFHLLGAALVLPGIYLATRTRRKSS